MDIERLRAELRNAKDPIESLILILAEHNEDDQRWQSSISGNVSMLRTEIAQFKGEMKPVIDAFSTSKYLKPFLGWVLSLGVGAVIAWEYVRTRIGA